MGADNKPQGAEVFDRSLIASLGNTVPKRWVQVPHWGDRWVCVWGTVQEDEIAIADEVQAALSLGSDQAPLNARGRERVATVIRCCREGEADGAKRIFADDDWQWLERQPTGTIDLIVNTVADLNRASPAMQEQLADFFVIAPSLLRCLRDIGSACGYCTDCPKNSQPTCPLVRLQLLSPLTESSESARTDGSATTAAASCATSSPA